MDKEGEEGDVEHITAKVNRLVIHGDEELCEADTPRLLKWRMLGKSVDINNELSTVSEE